MEEFPVGKNSEKILESLAGRCFETPWIGTNTSTYYACAQEAGIIMIKPVPAFVEMAKMRKSFWPSGNLAA